MENKYNRMKYSQDIVNRFWSKVKLPIDCESSDECWEWQAGKWNGYGQFLLYENVKVRSHRFSYEYFNGKIPDNMIIRHTCDNPSCCNPNHLLIGTQIDNIKDMIDRKRDKKVRGSNCGNSILSEDIVVDILEKIKNDEYTTQLQISKDYKISTSVISNILNGRNWTHVTKNYNLLELKNKFTHPNSLLDNYQVLEIKQLILDGKTNIEIGRLYNINSNIILRIRENKTYKHIV